MVGDVSDGGECPEVITRTYQITDECGNSISVSQVITIDAKCDIVIPSAFTPNGDSENDEWEIIDLDLVYPNNIVYVYNRWGNLIYTSNKGDYASKKWDGTYNEEVLPVGSYYYMILPNGEDTEKEDIINGTITIVKD
jgi:gliding motility-associated-like protein